MHTKENDMAVVKSKRGESELDIITNGGISMFKHLTVKEQLQKEQISNRKMKSKINAITKEIEIETEQGIEVVTEPILKEDTELLRDYVLDVDYRLILQELEIGGM